MILAFIFEPLRHKPSAIVKKINIDSGKVYKNHLRVMRSLNQDMVEEK